MMLPPGYAIQTFGDSAVVSKHQEPNTRLCSAVWLKNGVPRSHRGENLKKFVMMA